MKTKVLISIIAIVLVISIGVVLAHENFTETKKLIDSNISCDKLTNEQLEEIGDYYMEQMHPGEAHEMMHKMMGGEDSETTKLMHINMAKGIYCGETNQGMMGMMNMMSGGMMDSGNMMGMGGMKSGGGMMDGKGMYKDMTGYSVIDFGYWQGNILNILYIVFITSLITLIIIGTIKLLKGKSK